MGSIFSGHRLPMLVGILANGLAALVLVALLFVWKPVQRSGSRVLITLFYIAINVAFAYLWGTRYKDAETVARSDGVEVFTPEPIVGTVGAVFGAAAVGMYSRLEPMGAGGANVMYALSAGLCLLGAVLSSSFMTLSLYWWILGAVAAGVLAFQMFAWTIVPDTEHAAHTKRARRTGALPLFVVACFLAYLAALFSLVLSGSSMAAWIDSDGALYKWLFLGLVAAPMPIGSAVGTLLTYWSDVQPEKAVEGVAVSESDL